MTAAEYIAQGYRVTSNKHRMISRIDRDDWKEYMAKGHSPWDWEGEGLKWVRILGDRSAADHYRRVYSRDTLTVSAAIIKAMPNSGDMV